MKILDIGRSIYNFSDWLLNLQPYRNQEVEIAIFTICFIAELIGFVYGLFFSLWLSLLFLCVMASTLWVLVTMFYALDQMDKFRALKGNEDKELDNCATNLCVVIKCARHADNTIECKTDE